MDVISTTCLNSLRASTQDSEDKEQLTTKEELQDSDPEFLDEEEEDDGQEDEHDSFMRKFLISSHCTVCIYLSISLIMIGCFVALIVISVQVGCITILL